MDNFTGEMFADFDAYQSRMECESLSYEDCDTWDPIMGDADDCVETDDEWLDMDQAWNDEFSGEEDFA